MKTVYTSPYAKNLDKMHNSEKTALAKNRFTDAETQLAIAKDWYKLAQTYLASNPNITEEAADELWNRRGYVLKSLLLASGRKKLRKKEYAEVYRKYFKNNGRSHWRMMQAFFGGYHYWGNDETTGNNTPAELLEEIYADLPQDEHQRSYTLERFITHQNCSLNLALRISTMPDPPAQQYYHTDFNDLRQKALMKVAEITKRDGVDAR
jgi:hypothetical protein